MSNESHIIFIHGLANKPEPKVLERKWLEALSETAKTNEGFDLKAKGVVEHFIYWADLFYDKPVPESEYESNSDELADELGDEVDPESNAWTEAMLKKFPIEENEIFDDAPVSLEDEEYERVPLPWFIKKKVIKEYVREAHDYLFNENGVRDVIRKRCLDVLEDLDSNSNIVLVGHSMGSIIAYDILTGLDNCPVVDGMLTLGSPLGVDEVQDKLTWSRENGFPEKLNGDWVNVYDPYDVVARLDPKFADDFKKNGNKVVFDIKEENWGTWRHSSSKYLKGKMLRQELRRLAKRVE